MTPIKNLAFKGGGVLGIAYAGAIQVLEKNAILQGVEKVAGTSAGAITAALVSLNYTAAEITTIVQGTNFASFEDGKDLLRIATKYGIYKGDALLSWIEAQIVNKGFAATATFTDFKNAGCKDLYVFSSDLNIKGLRVFSYSETPNVVVAEAIRASMSIPMFFEAWTFTNNNPNDHLYVDGGMLYNFPITYFDTAGTPNPETMGLYLADIHNTAPPVTIEYNHVITYVKTVFETIMNAQVIDFQYDAEEKNRTAIIDNLGISAIDFNLTKDQQNALLQSGIQYATAYLATRMTR